MAVTDGERLFNGRVLLEHAIEEISAERGASHHGVGGADLCQWCYGGTLTRVGRVVG